MWSGRSRPVGDVVTRVLFALDDARLGSDAPDDSLFSLLVNKILLMRFGARS
jgi:hypothetical protein